jgi:hypothetical protein
VSKHRPSKTPIQDAVAAAAQELDPIFEQAAADVRNILGGELTNRQYYATLAVIEALRDDTIDRLTPAVSA